MSINLTEYDGGYRIVSLALDEKTKEELSHESVEFIYISEGVIFFSDGKTLSEDPGVIAAMSRFNNYDVLEILENGVARRCYNNCSDENIFFITEKCNSNCIMCPSPEASKKREAFNKINDLIEIASHIPAHVSHITITGGEPFMVGKDLFRLLDYCRNKFTHTEFQILTNGRIFALNDYCKMLFHTMPANTIVGIPLHGSNIEIHDAITQTKNSFLQTTIGLQKLLHLGIRVELRIVVCRLNAHDMERIAELIVLKFKHVTHVSIMAMEMTGNAFRNSEKVWIPYRESFLHIQPAIDVLVRAGIDVRLYNFPLCTVASGYRMLCVKSISSWKIRYDKKCDMCKLLNVCGGVFAGTLRLEKQELGILT